MSAITQYVATAVMEEHHPFLNSERCINRKQKRLPCTVCKDVCPEDVFQQVRGEHPKWERCIDCKLCVSSCPGRCLAAAPENLKPYLTGYDDSGIVRIGCTSSEHVAKLEEYCVASIPWEFIAYLALKMKVFLYTPCADCEDSVARRLLEEHLENLKHFLGEKLYKAHVFRIQNDDDTPPEDSMDRVVTRTELLDMVKSNIKNRALKAVADVNVEDYDGLFYRRLLAAHVQKLYEAAKEQGNRTSFEVKLPHFTSSCYTCDACIRLCPQEAISFGPIKDGKRGIYLTPWKCTACDVCRIVCRDHGIDELRFMKVPHLERLLVTRVDAKVCSKCGKAIKPNSESDLCTFCATKERTSRRKT